MTSGLGSTPWPCFGHDQKNTGLSPYDTSHIDGTEKWNFTTGGGVNCSFAIAGDGTIYTGSGDHYMYAINPDGTEKWSYQTVGNVRNSPALDDYGNIYVGGGDTLYSIRPDGTFNWTYETDGNIYSSPAIGDDGTIYLGTLQSNFPLPPAGYLTALNPDGTEKWNNEIGSSSIISSPAIAGDGTIYIGSPDYNLYAFNPDGSEKWLFYIGNYVDSSPAIEMDGTVYIGSNDNKLYAVYPDGTERWNFTTGDNILSSPAINSDGTIYVGSSDNKLYAIDPDGTERWNFTTGNDVDSSPTIGSDGTIYFGSDDNKIYALSPDGTEKWNNSTGDRVWSSPAIASDGTVYIGSADGNVYAIGWSTTPTYTIDLFAGGNSEGWNYVSFNITPLNDDLESILEDADNGISGNYDKVMYYYAKETEWETYVPTRASHFNGLKSWNHTMSLWIHMTADDNLTVNGTIPSTTTIPLLPGWNMVGYPSSTGRLASDTLPLDVSKIGVFNGSREYNLEYIYDLSTCTMTAGKGYWVYNSAEQKVDWTVNY
ncbi:MAG: PQQ-binding-like beta-propeller repeat protein [Thermoplasmata archaeon]